MKIEKYITEILISSAVLIILLYSSDPVLYSDSGRYLEQSLNDPPLYSFLISVLMLIFKSLNSVIIFQTLFVGFSIIFFTKIIKDKFNLSILVKILVAIFLFLPVIQFYKNLLTEPVSYAFSLLFVSFVIKLIYRFNIFNLCFCTFFVIILLLTRNQFIFLYPVIIILYLGICIIYSSKKYLFYLSLSFLCILIAHNSLIFLNTFIKQDSFNSEKLAYIEKGPYYFTYFDAIYISTGKDIELFENKNIKETLKSIFNEMDKKKALVKHYNGRGHFGLSLKEIKNYSNPLLRNLSEKENTSVISLKKEISIKLIKANFKKYTKLVFKKFYDSTWLFVFLPFFMLLAAMINFIKYKTQFPLLVLFLSTFVLANHSVVYLFGRVQPRYLIYTDFILLIFIFIIFNIFIQKKVL